MNSRNHKYALLLVAVVAVTATGAMTQAFAQQVTDGMDGYVKGTRSNFEKFLNRYFSKLLRDP